MEHITHNGQNLLTHLMIEILISERLADPDNTLPREIYSYFLAQFIHDYETDSLLVATRKMMARVVLSGKITDEIDFDSVGHMNDDDKAELSYHAATVVAGGFIVDSVLSMVVGSL